MPMKVSSRKVSDYAPDRVWSAFRREHSIRTDAFVTLEAFNSAVQEQVRKDRKLLNMGDDGIRQMMKVAQNDFGSLPDDQREQNIYIMKARGLITKDEFDIFTGQLGITRGAAEYRYRKFVKSDELIWELGHKNLLTRGEYTSLLKGHGLTYGQGYYRKRKYYAENYGIPFRKFHLKKPKP